VELMQEGGRVTSTVQLDKILIAKDFPHISVAFIELIHTSCLTTIPISMMLAA
jgi:hypothetical protein